MRIHKYQSCKTAILGTLFARFSPLPSHLEGGCLEPAALRGLLLSRKAGECLEPTVLCRSSAPSAPLTGCKGSAQGGLLKGMTKLLKILENPPKSIDFVYFRSILGISFENLEIAPSSDQTIIDEKSSDEKKSFRLKQHLLELTVCVV